MSLPYIPLVYVAGPYSAPTDEGIRTNIENAWEAGYSVAAMEAMPVIPHMNSAHMDDLHNQEWWLRATMELMYRCDAVLLIDGWENSKGAIGERAEALRIGLPVFTELSELAKWIDDMAALDEYGDCACACGCSDADEGPDDLAN